jgi:hypothetical protein
MIIRSDKHEMMKDMHLAFDPPCYQLTVVITAHIVLQFNHIQER